MFLLIRWFLLGLFAPGAGFWRAGKPQLAVAAWLALLPMPVGAVLFSLSPRKFIWLMLFTVVAWGIASIVGAALGARAARAPATGWRSVLVYCLGVVVLNSLMGELLASRLRAFRTPSESMNPSLVVGDQFYVMSDRARFPIVRGAVIVHDQPDSPYPFVRRVVGLEGDVVEWDGETLSINGAALARGPCEPDDPPSCHTEQLGKRRWRVRTDGLAQTGRWEVPAGSMFVMGDSRGDSLDSRYSGPLPLENARGVAEVIHLSWPQLARSGRPIDLTP